jgi:hypothetical protein
MIDDPLSQIEKASSSDIQYTNAALIAIRVVGQ